MFYAHIVFPTIDSVRASSRRRTRKGSIAVLSAILLIVLCACLAFVVDLGYLYGANNELQNSADAAAMAGACGLLNEQRLQGDMGLADVLASARGEAVRYAGLNHIVRSSPFVSPTKRIAFRAMLSSADPPATGHLHRCSPVKRTLIVYLCECAGPPIKTARYRYSLRTSWECSLRV